MCGICGVIQLRGEGRDVLAPGVIDVMTDVMSHRGPNDRGTYVSPGVAIGARRLSVVDVDGGHQPFANEDGTVWAAQNGELYNHATIRRELEGKGHRFRSVCDTEILPHLYEELGLAFAERLRGMFGLVVWDERRRQAVVARDRLGIKPLYWGVAGDVVVFGSELKSVLASGLFDGALDWDAIDAYLSFGFVPGPLSPIAGVRKLLPGHRLIIGDGKVREERWWAYPDPQPGSTKPGIDHYARLLFDELDESVRLRLMSDVPLGAMLSGGLDSSLIVALMARHMHEPVKTFSVGFVESAGRSELPDAQVVAAAFGTDHHALELSFREQVVELDELVWFLDEPLADLSSLGFFALSELAARSVTVALSGQGADELFGGYPKHQAASLAGYWDRSPGFSRRLGARVAPHARGRFRRAARTLAAPDPVTRLMAMSGKVDPALRPELMRGPLAQPGRDGGKHLVAAHLGSARGSALGLTLFIDGQLALVDDMLHYFDRASMAHSLEVRVPFLDHEVVRLAATIPDRFKVRGTTTKAVLKHAARGILPDRIIDKPKQGFFRTEVSDWFRAQADGAIAEYLLVGDARYSEFLDRATVERLVRAHLDGTGRRTEHLLLAILMLEIWLASFLPRAIGSRSSSTAVAAPVSS